MIVTMKKATVVALQAQQQRVLEDLRRLGLLHIGATINTGSESLAWHEKRLILEKALTITGLTKTNMPPKTEGEIDQALALAQSILDKSERVRSVKEEIETLRREEYRLSEWDGVALPDLEDLRQAGIDMMFLEVPLKKAASLPAQLRCFVFKRTKSVLWIAAFPPPGFEFELEFKQLVMPVRSADEVHHLLSRNQSELAKLNEEIKNLGNNRALIQGCVNWVGKRVELFEVAATMGQAEELCYLTGFLPLNTVESLREACRAHGWALLIQEPSIDDEVPTVVKNNRFIDIIAPVFQLLGTVPGYREFDISFLFLLFFTFFFATIIGDAAYGVVLFSGSLFFATRLHRQQRQIPAALSLMLVLSFATIIWGALTGTWFGSEKLAALPWLSWMTIPALSSFNPKSGETIKYIFFVVGTLHISIAHIWTFSRQVKEKPFLRSLAQLGWLSLVLGLYHLVLNLVLSSQKFPLPTYATWLIGSGLLFIIVFSRQEGRFFHGVAMGVSNLLTTFLSSISAFSDIISYIRLFAVGLAGIEIAKSFNAMAAGFGSSVSGFIIGGIILLLGHSLNLAMGSLSVVVHGVRLNMLEFSGHLGMEWTGRPYKPFKE